VTLILQSFQLAPLLHTHTHTHTHTHIYTLVHPSPAGCMFFLSDDERFLIKTMRKNELKILVEMLPMVRGKEEERSTGFAARIDRKWNA